MTDETKQENPETTAPDQAPVQEGANTAPSAADDGASSFSDGGLTLDDSEPEIAAPVEAPVEKPADNIPETSLSLEMDEAETAPAAPAADHTTEAAAPAEPVTEPPATPVFDDAGTTLETTPAVDEQIIASPMPEEPSFTDNSATDVTPEPAAMTGEETPPPPPVAETPQESFDENFDEFPGDDAAAFGSGGDDGGDDGFGGDDFGDDDGFPSEDGMMPVPEKSGSKKKMLMAGGALVLAAVVGGGYFILSSAGDVAPPPQRTAKVAKQAPAPAAGNDFAAANIGDNSHDSGLAGFTPPPQPTPLTNTDNLDSGFGEETESAALAVGETNAVPPADGWAMDDEGSAGDLTGFGAMSAGDDLSADAENGDVSDYDPSRETVTLTGLDDGALPPPPVETEAEAAPLDFAAADGDAAAEQETAEITADPVTTEAAETATAESADTQTAASGTTTDTSGDAAAADSAAAGIAAIPAEDDPLTALEQNDPLVGENGFTDSPPVAISDLEPPGMMGTQASTMETPQTDTAAVKKTADPLTEPAVEAAIAPKPQNPPAPVPGEPPPILSGTDQVKDMMPPTKPALTAAEQMRIEQARVAMSQGELEGDAIEEHKKTLREVPAKEAMIRPLPKSYLIMQRADGQAGKSMSPPQPQAGTSLATISSKPDMMGQAIAEQKAGNTAAALQSYEKILSDNPSDLNALTNMLGILRKQHTSLALEKLTELHSLYPRHPGIAAQLAVTHADKKDYKEALHYFDIAASLDSPNAYYPFSKGVILDKMGRRGEANNYYQEALTMLEQGKTGRQQVPLNALRRRLGIPAY